MFIMVWKALHELIPAYFSSPFNYLSDLDVQVTGKVENEVSLKFTQC